MLASLMLLPILVKAIQDELSYNRQKREDSYALLCIIKVEKGASYELRTL